MDFISFQFLILQVNPSKLSQLWQNFNFHCIFRLLFAVTVVRAIISLCTNLQLSVSRFVLFLTMVQPRYLTSSIGPNLFPLINKSICHSLPLHTCGCSSCHYALSIVSISILNYNLTKVTPISQRS